MRDQERQLHSLPISKYSQVTQNMARKYVNLTLQCIVTELPVMRNKSMRLPIPVARQPRPVIQSKLTNIIIRSLRMQYLIRRPRKVENSKIYTPPSFVDFRLTYSKDPTVRICLPQKMNSTMFHGKWWFICKQYFLLFYFMRCLILLLW